MVGIYDMYNYNDCDNAESICTLWHCKIANHSGILKYILNYLIALAIYLWIPTI